MGKKTDVLLVVDNVSDTRLLEDALGDGNKSAAFETESASLLDEACEKLEGKDYDALVLDLSGRWGMDSLLKLRQADGQIPLIVLADISEWESGNEAVRKGADDWVVKDELLKYNLPHILRYTVEHKKRERDFRDSQKLLRMAIDSLKLNIAILDENGTLIEVNKAWCEFARDNGLEWEDYGIGSNYLDVCKSDREDEYARSAYEGIKKLVEGKDDELYFEYPCHSPDEKRWFSMRASGFAFKDTRRIIVAHENITDRVFAEQEQSKLVEELEKSNKELKDFVNIISHDLKSPLRGIKMLSEWISEDYSDKLDEDGRENLDLLIERADKMHRQIEQILDYSRIGRIRERQVSVDLNELVGEVIQTISPPENIKIKIRNPLPVITCEQTRMNQLFRNLVDNAVKYMDKKEGVVEIDCVRDGDFYEFRISDNGPGIEEKNFDRIFQIFQSVIPCEDFERMGTGLTLAKKIVQVNGGEIWLESEPGEGTRFYFTLPVTGVRQEENEPISKKSKSENPKVIN